jgi:WD40 repeat protein/energy-coupling factor transporter ATP-binding protein EcfA2
MASLFVSHSSRDLPATKRVVERLAAEGFAALFLDFDPAQGIPAGRSWEPELYAQLRKADGVIFLASPTSVLSQWCFAEVSLARSLGKPVFPLRLEANVRLGLLDDVQWVDLAEGDAAFARLWAGLRRAGLDPSDSFGWDPARSPYPGLESFASEDAAVFFGRDHEIDRLLELLQPTLQRGGGRFVAIVGPSGSGKSSLLRAGLLPRLARLEARWVALPALVPGQQPTRNLARSLASAFAARGHTRPLAEVAASLGRGAGGLVELAAELAELSGNGDGRPSVLVLVDQAEELLTRSGVGEQQAFLGLLDGALSDDSPVWVVATVRSEFLSTAPERAGLAEVVDDPLVVEPLSRARLPEVIQRPAQRAGLEFAPGLVERMVEETTGGDALPLLAYTLRELYQRTGPDGRVSAADYEAVGGVVGALQRRADRLAAELARRGQGRLIIPTLLQLAAVEGDGEPTRRRVRRRALRADEQAVAEAFVDARLLTSSTAADGETMVEVAHEALLRQWPPLREAIEAARASLRLRSELERLAADWIQGRRDESYLLRGGRLTAFDRWAGEHGGELSPVERQFLEASRALASRELEAARRSNRRLRALVGGLAVLLVLTLAAGGLAVQRNQQVQAQARLALSRQLAGQANGLVDTQPQTAILAGLQSLSLARAERPKPSAPAGLVTGLARVTHASRLFLGHPDAVNGVAFSPDGRLLATGSRDRTARLWEVGSGRPWGRPLTGHTNTVDGVAFSPDGRLLATASADRTVRLWEVRSGRPWGRPLTGHTDAVTGVAFSPDGRLLATSSWDRTARLWEVRSGRPWGRPLTGHTNMVYRVAFSPDGKLLATASRDQTVRLWEAGSGRPRGQPLTGHTDAVSGVAFSPDGRLLATSSLDQTARLWEVAETYSVGRPFIGHTDAVNGVAFSPDGRLLATVSRDRTVRLWEVGSGRPHGQPLTGHTDTVYEVAFSPDGKLLATTSVDRTVRLWEVESGRPHGQPLTGHTDTVYGVAFSPDGRLLATGSADRTARLWEVGSGRPHGQPLTGHTDTVYEVAFSPDGRLLATASVDRTARLWNPTFTSWVAYGCKMVNRNLSMVEWDQLLPGLPYERTCPELPAGKDAPTNAPAARY